MFHCHLRCYTLYDHVLKCITCNFDSALWGIKKIKKKKYLIRNKETKEKGKQNSCKSILAIS